MPAAHVRCYHSRHRSGPTIDSVKISVALSVLLPNHSRYTILFRFVMELLRLLFQVLEASICVLIDRILGAFSLIAIPDQPEGPTIS